MQVMNPRCAALDLGLKALIAGETDAERLADLAHPRLQVKRERLVEVLHGRLTLQQRRLLAMYLKLIETIDQLLGYLSWRDSKAAILLFNRNKDFSKVLSTISEVVRAHRNFQKDEGNRGETAFRYAFRHKDDAAKLLHLSVIVFDIPSPAGHAQAMD